jgi:catechol 2,3-dioxygenase-like lactoylglutathione lyase family enzyme
VKIVRSHHVSFSVAELPRSRHFYESILGLDEIPRPAMGLDGAWYRAGDGEIHLIVRPPGVDVGAPPPRTTPLANHVALAIEDYDEAVAYLRGEGFEPIEAGRANGQLWIADPDGNVIELIVPRSSAAS